MVEMILTKELLAAVEALSGSQAILVRSWLRVAEAVHPFVLVEVIQFFHLAWMG